MKRLRVVLAYILSVAVMLDSFSSFGQMAVADASAPRPPVEDITKSMFSFIPGWDDFAADESDLPKLPEFEKNDPILDQDPYFLRSQHWVQADGEVPAITTADNGTGFDIQIPHSPVILHVDQPMRPVVAADDYIFLQANSPDFFKSKIKDESEYGEGLFFIDIRDLKAESERSEGDRHGIPIFFLPTDGKGWTEPLVAVEKRQLNTLDFRNPEGESESIDFGQLDDLSKILHYALSTAVALEMSHQSERIRQKALASIQAGDQNIELPYILPPRGSTAAFGLFFTGLDLDHPDQSVGTLISHFNWLDWMFPKAHAAEKSSLGTRLLIVSGFVVASFVGSYIAKKTVLKGKMKAIRALIEEADDFRRAQEKKKAVDRTRLRYRMAMGAVDTLSITTQVFATQEFLPTVSTGYVGEYIVDKWLGDSGSAPNAFVRKYLVEKGLLFDRGQAEKVRANAWTFWLGTVVLGGEDIVSVIPQMFYLNQIVLPWLGGFISTELAAQMAHQYGGGSAAGTNVLHSEMMRNISSYTIHGAYSYAQEMVAFFETLVRPKIEDQVRHDRNIDPDSAAGRKLVDELVKEKLEPLLVSRGLPSSDQHLFDASGLIKKLVKTRGYKVNPVVMNPEEPDTVAKDHFILEHGRWGVLSRVLENMVDAAKRFYALNPSSTVKRALVYTKDIQAKFHKYKNWMSKPLHYKMASAEAKEMREMLTALSYLDEGPVFSSKIKYMHLWKGYTEDPDAAELSARWFRQSLFATLEGKPYYLYPSDAQMKKYAEVALAEADSVLQAQGEPYSEGDKKLLSIEIIKGKIAAEEHQSEVASYEPYPKRFLNFDNGVLPVRWLGKSKTERQLRRIQENALHATARLARNVRIIKHPELIADPAIQPIYEDAFRNAWLDETNLYTLPPQYSANVQKSLDEAEESFRMTFEKEKLRHYYSRLSKVDQAQLIARMKTEAFINAYTRQMVEAGHAELPDKEKTAFLRSAEQPGFFQNFRMHSKWCNRPRVLARALNVVLRGFEMPFQTTYNLGAKAWRYRNVPWAGDHTTAWKNRFKRLFLMMTAYYTTNYYVWQVQYDWSTYLFLYLTFTYLSTFATSLDRFMMNVGKPAMDSTGRKAFFGEIWTWVTWPLAFPFFLFNERFSAYWDRFVWGPMVEGGGFLAGQGKHLFTICEKLLTGG